jgi:CRP/FNR family cyclic AMP-dependent transcriptional regulator
MIERFQGEHNCKKLIDELREQIIVGGDEALAAALCDKLKLFEAKPGELIISQNEDDDDLYLIIAGRVSVRVHDREIAVTRAGEHVGEMSLIDPKARRSATVLALEPTVLGKVTEPDFTTLAEKFPRLWRRLAVQLGERLRQRNEHIVKRNAQPVIFVGSSKESKAVAQEIQSCFRHDDFVVRPWTNEGVFVASNYTMEDLEQQVRTADFAVMVFGPDDKVLSRGEESDAPRDNVIFELGLFMGALTRQRTFIVRPRGADLKVPSDLLGLKPLEYANGEPNTLSDRIAPVCHELRKIINVKGSK